MPRKTPPGFAGDTEVPIYKSKADIEGLLMKYGAEGYHTGWQATQGTVVGWDVIEFLWKGKQIRFRIPRSTEADVPRTVQKKSAYLEQRDRQRWRVLMLVVKAKLEAVQSGVSIFEEEFMPFIVMGNGKTIGEVLIPRIQAATGSTQLQIPEMTGR